MKVYNKEKTLVLGELDTFDASNGKLIDDTIDVTIPGRPAIERKTHYETVKVYENGGKDVIEVVDVEGQEAEEAHVEHVPVKVYVEYTEEERAEIEHEKAQAQLRELEEQKKRENLEYLASMEPETLRAVIAKIKSLL